MPKVRAGVTRRKGESIDSLLNRFGSEVYKTRVLKEYMDRMYYTSDAEKRAEEKKKKKFESYLHGKRDN